MHFLYRWKLEELIERLLVFCLSKNNKKKMWVALVIFLFHAFFTGICYGLKSYSARYNLNNPDNPDDHNV